MKRPIIFLLVLVACAFAQGWVSGIVEKVSDGDTFRLLTSSGIVKVRLYGIDAPESQQEFGQQSKAILQQLVLGRRVNVRIRDTDRYGRSIGELWIGDSVDVNLWMVRNGFAWWYRSYGKDRQDIGSAEAAARKEGLGIWAYAQPQAPWEWRSLKRSEADRRRGK